MNGEADDAVDLNEETSINIEEDVKLVGESSMSLLFLEMMKILLSHRRPLRDWIKDKMISYVDLLRPHSPLIRGDNEMKSETSRRLAKWK